MPASESLLVYGDSLRSEPVRTWPLLARTSAIPLIPAPPMPIICIFTALLLLSGTQQSPGYLTGRIRGGEGAHTPREPLPPSIVVQQIFDAVAQCMCADLGVEHDLCGSSVGKVPGVLELVVARRVREGDEDRRLPSGRYVEQRACAGSANNHVGGGQVPPDIVDILEDPVPRVVRREPREIPAARDLDDRIRRRTPERLRRREVDPERTPAPTED